MEMTRERFEELVSQALDEVPEQFAPAFDEVAVVVEEYAPPGPGALFGLYQGVPRTYGDRSGHLPPHISIYMDTLVRHFGHDERELVRQVRITVLHELGHHLGMDEDQLERLGYA
jgi:predicted Zn-dependent protease with MMP-like domain